ncbi:MAG TPA: sulfatase-like hydrolase/transferase, partial [Lacipirellulaceae bacterium]|nr:sulfatase-like hydrolase/transferase [Lacipirellulaceae bacterium]
KQQDFNHFAHIANPTQRTLAAMTYALDRNVGSIMQALSANGIADNTIVVFINDNGGTADNNNGILRGFKGYAWEGGIRIPYTVKMPGVAPGVFDHPISMFDLLPTFVSAAGGEIPPEEADQLVGSDLRPYCTGEATGR